MSQVQPPPHDLGAEQAVLTACVYSRDVFAEIQGVVLPEHCYSPTNRRILEAIYGLEEEGRKVDLVAIRGWLATHGLLDQVGADGVLKAIQVSPAIGNATEHAQTVRDKARLRALISTCQRAAAEGHGDCGDVQAFIDQTEQQIFDIARVESRTDVVALSDATKEALQIISAAAASGAKGVTGVPTKFDELDRLTTGLHPGELFVVAGRPGMGKTSFVLNIAANIARATYDQPSEWGAAVFSLEMPKEQLAMRLLASEARVDLSRLRSGAIRGDDWARITEASARLSRMPVWIDDTPAITLLELRSKVRRLQSRLAREERDSTTRKLGLVAIDYLQLMQGRRNAGSREQEISELSRGLKQLAKELEVPVMALSQLNRSVETRSKGDKRPQLSDLRESGAIEQDADAILFVYRDEYYFKDESVDRGVAEVIVAKQRNGPTSTIRTKFTSEYTRFDNLARDEVEERPEWSYAGEEAIDDWDRNGADMRSGLD